MKQLAYAILAASMSVVAAAQPAYIPDNMPSVGGNSNEPLNMSSTSGRYQQIIPAQYLPMTPVKITKIAFAQASVSPTTFQVSSDFQIRMSHTTLTCPTSTFANNMAPVPTVLVSARNGYTYNAPQLSGWADFTTTQDFGYDGMSNLCIEVRFRGQNTSLGFWTRSTGGIGKVYANSTSADNYNATTGTASCTNGLKVRLDYTRNNCLVADETASVGGALQVALFGLNPGETHVVAASFGKFPLQAGPFKVYLAPDGLFNASLTVGPPLFNNYVNFVPGAGNTGAILQVPNVPALAGTIVYHAAVTFANNRVTGATNTGGTLIVP